VLGFEPDRQIAVSGFSILDPKFTRALCDVFMERHVLGVVGECDMRVWFLHNEES